MKIFASSVLAVGAIVGYKLRDDIKIFIKYDRLLEAANAWRHPVQTFYEVAYGIGPPKRRPR